MSAAKKALLDQYAYDTSERYDNDGNLIVDTGGKSGGSGNGGKKDTDGEENMSNHAMAQKANMENKALSMKKAQSTSTNKKEERIKTKNAKIDKMKAKEERRKRATKGERRR